ncbi:uncharacterized protein P174DRAFT_109932 [Aspergillus novofumigatus IBT 16806]|uniref:Uncharacterized protein n=1 Tax=Aspergillus novofumigatus (strain IBT 16806) TaxID=1392255 RepID=A0A2I1CIF0_ASPN1|nr:uncharacterized protein P174DRAFT_109932 [Aspergillus novofumigatus IBT 16806]PKX97415.1 hypothetical protein P174DRAFT_109932 [Aspergillus novofumigatus IBT 16806]
MYTLLYLEDPITPPGYSTPKSCRGLLFVPRENIRSLYYLLVPWVSIPSEIESGKVRSATSFSMPLPRYKRFKYGQHSSTALWVDSGRAARVILNKSTRRPFWHRSFNPGYQYSLFSRLRHPTEQMRGDIPLAPCHCRSFKVRWKKNPKGVGEYLPLQHSDENL